MPDAGMDPAVINDPSLWFQDVQASNNVYLLVKGSDHRLNIICGLVSS